MRKTKIVCTIGPACRDEETITQMAKAGMNVARLNFSHGDHTEHKENVDLIKKVRKKLGVPIAIMLDTKGPEYRIGTFKDGKITVGEGDVFSFTTEDVVGDTSIVSVNYKGLVEDLEVGDKIFVNNGLVVFEVTSIEKNRAVCKCLEGGELRNRKSMSFPEKVLSQTYLSENDKNDLLFGIKHGVDFVACSFVSGKQDLLDVRAFLKENGCEDIDLIAKIENRSGVENIEDIGGECDGIMIARGDLGVEIPFEEVPAVQKKLITKCRMMGKRVITATEMLESMIYNIRPTRAEISDVANAVYDGTSALMLSGETAAGKNPVVAVETMAKVARETEGHINYQEEFRKSDFEIKNIIDAVSHSSCGMAIEVGAQAIVVCTMSGVTARMVSRFRAPVNIIGMTLSEKVYHKLALSWGVIPVLSEEFNTTDVLVYQAVKIAEDVLKLKKGDHIVVTSGRVVGESGNTNMIRVESV